MGLLVVKSYFTPLQYKTTCIIKNILSFPTLKESTYRRYTIASIMEQLKRKETSEIKISNFVQSIDETIILFTKLDKNC
jgi:hypothetical protein